MKAKRASRRQCASYAKKPALSWTRAQLRDAAVHKYLPRKDLHLFVLDPPDPSLEIGQCRCSTHYTPRYGKREIPEVDDYRWTPRVQVPELCGKNMTRVLMALDW